MTWRGSGIEVFAGVGRSRTYYVSKPCGKSDGQYNQRSGSIPDDNDLRTLAHDVVEVAEFDGEAGGAKCRKTGTPSAKDIKHLETLLMMLRTFPAVPENKGMWWE
jgi:hypothetical protein